MTKIVFLGGTALAAVIVALVLTTGGKQRTPAPSSFVGNQANCASQVGVDAAQRAFRLCLFRPRLFRPVRAHSKGPVHWGVVTSVGA